MVAILVAILVAIVVAIVVAKIDPPGACSRNLARPRPQPCERIKIYTKTVNLKLATMMETRRQPADNDPSFENAENVL